MPLRPARLGKTPRATEPVVDKHHAVCKTRVPSPRTIRLYRLRPDQGFPENLSLACAYRPDRKPFGRDHRKMLRRRTRRRLPRVDHETGYLQRDRGRRCGGLPHPRRMDLKAMQVALVTGAGSRLGKVLARHLARNGYMVIVHVNRTREEGRKLVREIVDGGHHAAMIPCNFERPSSVAGFFEKIVRRHGPPRLIIN